MRPTAEDEGCPGQQQPWPLVKPLPTHSPATRAPGRINSLIFFSFNLNFLLYITDTLVGWPWPDAKGQGSLVDSVQGGQAFGTQSEEVSESGAPRTLLLRLDIW